jgi:hypothetical protein
MRLDLAPDACINSKPNANGDRCMSTVIGRSATLISSAAADIARELSVSRPECKTRTTVIKCTNQINKYNVLNQLGISALSDHARFAA